MGAKNLHCAGFLFRFYLVLDAEPRVYRCSCVAWFGVLNVGANVRCLARFCRFYAAAARGWFIATLDRTHLQTTGWYVHDLTDDINQASCGE